MTRVAFGGVLRGSILSRWIGLCAWCDERVRAGATLAEVVAGGGKRAWFEVMGAVLWLTCLRLASTMAVCDEAWRVGARPRGWDARSSVTQLVPSLEPVLVIGRAVRSQSLRARLGSDPKCAR